MVVLSIAVELQALLKRGLGNLFKRGASCGPHTDELHAAMTDLYVKVASVAGIINSVLVKPGTSGFDPEQSLIEMGVDPNDAEDMREEACKISSKLVE